jgi:hypothetical protein
VSLLGPNLSGPSDGCCDQNDSTVNTMAQRQSYCADCGSEEGVGGDVVSLKMCKSCMNVKYCNAKCQKNHWPKHKKECKLRAAELRDAAVFKDPPPKEDCPICFLPMPKNLICCVSLPPATILSVPVYDFADANDDLAEDDKTLEQFYSCCGKSICKGCVYSFIESGNIVKCPFCNSERGGLTADERFEEVMKWVGANDAGAIHVLGTYYYSGLGGLQQDRTKGMELYARAAELGHIEAHYFLGNIYDIGGDLKKAKFHWEAAAMAGHEIARYNLGTDEYNSGNKERAIKHWTIAAASAGCYRSMNNLRIQFERGFVSRELINSTLAAYNKYCAGMRSEARDNLIQLLTED